MTDDENDTIHDDAPTRETRADAVPSSEGPREAIGRFRLAGLLGRGGFGSVYRAYDPTLDRTVALKVMHPSSGGDPTAQRRRTLREARAAAALAHPNAVTIFEVGEADGNVFIAMELIEGATLRHMLREAPARAHIMGWLLAGSVPALAFAGETPFVFWSAPDGPGGLNRIFATKKAGGAFSQPVVIDDATALGPPVARGNTIAWMAEVDGKRMVRIAKLDAKGVVSRPSDVAAPGGARDLSVSEANVAWIDDHAGSAVVHHLDCKPAN